jgi:transposase
LAFPARSKKELVITDSGYDSDPLRFRSRPRGIELICPHKKNRVRPATQDGRKLRCYKRRWIVERTIGWLGNFRRLMVHYDRSLKIYRACFMIVSRRVLQ